MSSITRADVVEYATASAMHEPINVAIMAEITAYRTLTKSDDAVLCDHTRDQPDIERYATAISGAITVIPDTNPTTMITTQWIVRDGVAACELTTASDEVVRVHRIHAYNTIAKKSAWIRLIATAP